MKKLLKWIGIVFIGIVIIGLITTMLEENEGSAEPNEATVDATTDSTDDNEDVEEDDDEETNDITRGEEFEMEDWRIVLNSTDMVENIQINDFMDFSPSDEGNLYLVVDLTITNTGTNAKQFIPVIGTSNDMSVRVYYDGDFEYSPATLIGYDNCIASLATISPLGERNGILAFSVPPIVQESDNELAVVFSQGSEEMTYRVR